MKTLLENYHEKAWHSYMFIVSYKAQKTLIISNHHPKFRKYLESERRDPVEVAAQLRKRRFAAVVII